MLIILLCSTPKTLQALEDVLALCDATVLSVDDAIVGFTDNSDANKKPPRRRPPPVPQAAAAAVAVSNRGYVDLDRESSMYAAQLS